MISESMRSSWGGKVPGGRAAEGAGAGAGVCGMTGLFSLFVSDGGLETGRSVGDDDNGAKKVSDKSESGPRGTDDGMVAADEKGCGGGGGGGSLGIGNSAWAICLDVRLRSQDGVVVRGEAHPDLLDPRRHTQQQCRPRGAVGGRSGQHIVAGNNTGGLGLTSPCNGLQPGPSASRRRPCPAC